METTRILTHYYDVIYIIYNGHQAILKDISNREYKINGIDYITISRAYTEVNQHPDGMFFAFPDLAQVSVVKDLKAGEKYLKVIE